MEHKTIRGGELWLPFARSRLLALKALGMEYVSQQFVMSDGATVRVRIAGEHEYIDLAHEPGGYQFFSTGPKLTTRGYLGFRMYDGYAVATGIAGDKPKALASSVELGPVLDGPGSPPAWPLVEPLAITKAFPVKNIWQIQGIPEHTFYPRKPGTNQLSKARLVDSWASSTQITGMPQRGGYRYKERLSSKIDVAFDAAPTLGSKPRAPDADWYKRAATRTVEHPVYGTRRFVILSDITNNFYIYPVDANEAAEPNELYLAQGIKTNIAPVATRILTSPLPVWCRKSPRAARDIWRAGVTTTDLITEVPQYRWAFNSTATHACAVVFEDLEAFTGVPGLTELPSFADERGNRYAIQESLPGLVEVEIKIELTGAELVEFDVSATITQELRASVTGKYIMSADYAWPMPGQAAIDDLLVLTGSIYHTSLERATAGKEIRLENCKGIIEIENLTAGTLLRTILTSHTTQSYMGTPSRPFDNYPDAYRVNANAIILALDLRLLAFTVRQKCVRYALIWNSPTSGGAEQDGLVAMRVKTYVRNELVDEIIMEPDGSATDAALVDSFAHTSVAGMFKMPVTERGGVSYYTEPGTLNGYWGLGLKVSGNPYANYIDASTGPGVAVDVGAFLYSALMASTMCMTSRALFAIHPDGHWSLSTQPVTYHAGPVGLDEDGIGIAGAFDVSLMRSTRVDLVSFRAKPTQAQTLAGELGTETRKTHIEMLSAAFKKDWTAASFLPHWGKVQVSTPLSRITLVVDSVSDRCFELERQYRPSEGASWSYEPISRPAAFDLQLSPLSVSGSYTGKPVSDLYDHTPLLGGSTLFL